jgi:hypothetical protein
MTHFTRWTRATGLALFASTLLAVTLAATRPAAADGDRDDSGHV